MPRTNGLQYCSAAENARRAAFDRLAHPETEYIFEASGLTCRIVRMPRGFYCGYVDLPDDHPDAENTAEEWDETFAAPGGWTAQWGFDCAHHRDFQPSNPEDDRHYWARDEVEATLRSVAYQLDERRQRPASGPATTEHPSPLASPEALEAWVAFEGLSLNS